MITIDNYFDATRNFDWNNYPEPIRKGNDYLRKVTDDGRELSNYRSNEAVKRVLDLYLSKLNTLLEKQEESAQSEKEANRSKKSQPLTKKKAASNQPKESKSTESPEQSDDEIKFHDPRKLKQSDLEETYKKLLYIDSTKGLSDEDKDYKVALFREINRRLPKTDPHKLYSQDIPPETNYDHWRIEFRNIKKMDADQLREEIQKVVDVWNYNGLTKKEEKYRDEIQKLLNKDAPAILTERIPDELRFVRRFVNLDGKTKTKEEILRLVNSLQKAIVEKRIRKTSAYAEQIRFIQDRLIETYNAMKAKIKIELKPETREALQKLTGEQKVMVSINFIKRYMGLNGKAGVKEKARKLLDQINNAIDKGKITDSDPYIIEIHELKKHLHAFTSGKGQKVLEIEKATLNGLSGILGCACQSLDGIEDKPTLMNSMDFANMQFTTIGLKGKWRDLIGDPAPNFTAMVFGKPKMGKSYLCVDFAGYLARHHGKVLYVAKEEGLDSTMQKKLRDKNVAHPNLFVSAALPASLSGYNFIFLDSVNRLGLLPADLLRLKADNPGKSFVFIFQSTKDGNFRGNNAFQHDVDIVIEVPEKGRAIQYGRFNQGGEMDIFPSKLAA